MQNLSIAQFLTLTITNLKLTRYEDYKKIEFIDIKNDLFNLLEQELHIKAIKISKYHKTISFLDINLYNCDGINPITIIYRDKPDEIVPFDETANKV